MEWNLDARERERGRLDDGWWWVGSLGGAWARIPGWGQCRSMGWIGLQGAKGSPGYQSGAQEPKDPWVGHLVAVGAGKGRSF